MNLTIDTSKQYAASLRQALKDIADPSALSHAQCLDLLARVNGQADWNTLRSRLWKTYFYERLEPYRPNPATILRSMSVRKAVIAELADFEETDQVNLATALRSMHRVYWQVNAVGDGALKVEPELRAALQAAHQSTEPDLIGHQSAAAKDFAGLQDAWGPGPLTVFQAERFQNSYLEWRLATLSRALRDSEAQLHANRLSALAEREVDIYSLCAHLFTEGTRGRKTDAAEMQKQLERLRHHPLRQMGKALFLSVLAGDSPELARANIASRFALDLDPGFVSSNLILLREAFPEVTVWQTWIELKPHLAPDADSFHYRRTPNA